MLRWIIHVDMDAFYAAVEQRDNPDLRGKPVVVGGLGGRGVVSTASYEARKFGVHSAMPMTEARRRCPHGIFVAGNHRQYAAVSAQIHKILHDFSPLVEPLALDEAFLDVSGMEWLYPSPEDMARQIKARIKEELDLTASAGVAPNKFLAKLASDWGKPNGLVVIQHGQEAEFLRNIPIERLWGAGETTAKALKAIGVQTIGHLAKADDIVLAKHFGNSAATVRRLARGQDDRPVVPEQAPKSIGNEVTFAEDIKRREELETELMAITQKVARRLRKAGFAGRTVTVKLRFASFATITRSRTFAEPTYLDDVIYDTAKQLSRSVDLAGGIRLLGVTMGNLQLWSGQTSLFAADDDKLLKMSDALDKLKDRYGETVITRGRLLPPKS